MGEERWMLIIHGDVMMVMVDGSGQVVLLGHSKVVLTIVGQSWLLHDFVVLIVVCLQERIMMNGWCLSKWLGGELMLG